MATRTLGALVVLLLAITICEAASIFHPISDSHRSAASELFTQGSFDSLEEAYEALRSFEVLGIDKPDIRGATCKSVVKKLGSSESAPKDLFYALKVNSILKCEVKKDVFEGIASRLKAVVNGASSLLDIYYSIGSLVLIKDQTSEVDVLLADADGIFRSIKSLSQSDGRWRYSSDNPQSSTYAAGLAIEALAGVVSLASSEIDQSMIGKLKRDVSKLFDSVEKYDDGAFYFDEKVDQSPLSTTASVVRGLTALAAVTSEKLKVPGEKILGLAKFFLGIGIPGKNKDFFNQTDSLASLESNNVSVALILSLLTTVLSLTKKDQLKAKVNTVLGSSASPLTVRLVRAFSSDSKDASIIASQIGKLNRDVSKLFDSVEKYDDVAFYFDENVDQSPLPTTASVVRGLTALAAVTSKKLKLAESILDFSVHRVPGEKILGLAKFFLGIGIPGNNKDFFNQIDSLAFLESNKVSVPLILSLPTTVLSLTKKDQLKVKVGTVLGSSAPPLTVKLMRAFSSGSKDASIIASQELKFDKESGYHVLDVLPKSVDVGSYIFVFEVVLHDSEDETVYTTGGLAQVGVFVTGVINIENAEISVLESDKSVETQKKLDLAGENAVSLSANHLQKLRLSFQLTTPLGHAFKPHQVFLKLTHETKVEHMFVVGNSGKKFEKILDFLGLVDKFYYLSGSYDLQLTVGDAVMENSFLRAIGHIDLDLPEAPEKATRPPSPAVNPLLKYGPKAEISHIFRVPEKLPPNHLSLAFLGLLLLPLIGFLVGLLRLGVNLKNFPTSAVPATFGILFHVGIAAVLLLYVLFWLKLDLFTTLKWLGLLGVFLLFVGHRILSHLASTSSKLKSA